MDITSFLETAKGIGTLGSGGAVVYCLYRIVDKLLDMAEAGRKRRADNESATNAELRKHNDELQKRIDEQVVKVADANADLRVAQVELKYANNDNQAKTRQLAELTERLREEHGNLVQSRTVNEILMKDILPLLDDDEGREFLRRKAVEKKR